MVGRKIPKATGQTNPGATHKRTPSRARICFRITPTRTFKSVPRISTLRQRSTAMNTLATPIRPMTKTNPASQTQPGIQSVFTAIALSGFRSNAPAANAEYIATTGFNSPLVDAATSTGIFQLVAWMAGGAGLTQRASPRPKPVNSDTITTNRQARPIRQIVRRQYPERIKHCASATIATTQTTSSATTRNNRTQ